MLEEPTIRKAGVVASQKRHLGRTIATPPLPYTTDLVVNNNVLIDAVVEWIKPITVLSNIHAETETHIMSLVKSMISKMEVDGIHIDSNTRTHVFNTVKSMVVPIEFEGLSVKADTSIHTYNYVENVVVNVRRTDINTVRTVNLTFELV